MSESIKIICFMLYFVFGSYGAWKAGSEIAAYKDSKENPVIDKKIDMEVSLAVCQTRLDDIRRHPILAYCLEKPQSGE